MIPELLATFKFDYPFLGNLNFHGNLVIKKGMSNANLSACEHLLLMMKLLVGISLTYVK